MKLRTKAATVLMLAVLCGWTLTAAGCRKALNFPVISHEIAREGEISMRYRALNEEKVYEFTLSDDTKGIHCTVETVSGSLEVLILRPDESEPEGVLTVYQEKFTVSKPKQAEPVEKEILVTKGGTYRIVVTGKDHQGSYAFVWEK